MASIKILEIRSLRYRLNFRVPEVGLLPPRISEGGFVDMQGNEARVVF
jgi:hypothetical protein